MNISCPDKIGEDDVICYSRIDDRHTGDGIVSWSITQGVKTRLPVPEGLIIARASNEYIIYLTNEKFDAFTCILTNPYFTPKPPSKR